MNDLQKFHGITSDIIRPKQVVKLMLLIIFISNFTHLAIHFFCDQKSAVKLSRMQ
jgi:hypothetical protein